MPIPDSIAAFIQAQVVTDILCLPQNYPTPDSFDAFQDGYRRNANTGQTLIGEGDGAFKPTWYVLCTNYFDDPFFVDFSEAALHFPVCYAPHGAGRWDALPVAKTITEFAAILSELIQVKGDVSHAIAVINRFPFAGQRLWQEAIEQISEQNEP